jgi:RNA polymerase sigma-70 factor (ECF subfamily)
MPDYRRLIQRILAQDESAFETLYHATKYAVYSIIYAIVKDKDDTEDLMQDTYLKMVKALPSYDGSSQFTTWLLTIAKRTAIDHYRKERRIVHLKDIDTAIIPDLQANRSEHQMEAEHYLKVLSDEERQIVLLKIVDRMTHKEIARLFDKPAGTIAWLYHQAMQKIKKAAKEELDIEIQP